MAEIDYKRFGCSHVNCVSPSKVKQLCRAHYKKSRHVPKHSQTERACICCGVVFTPINRTVYCSKSCKTKAWHAKNPNCKLASVERARQERIAKNEHPAKSAYFAGSCSCGAVVGNKGSNQKCGACRRRMNADRTIGYELAAHKRTARVTQCAGCNVEFCPLYGSSNSELCAPCAHDRMREHKRMGKSHIVRAKRYGVAYAYFNPLVVLRRDGWQCQLCGVSTPESLRGTYDSSAPELDHRKPLSVGGEHTQANTQCVCRACNSAKGSDEYWVSKHMTPIALGMVVGQQASLFM